MRGASAAEGRPKGRTAGVFVATLQVIAVDFALFFSEGTGCAARNRGDRRIACCCSTCSTNVIDFTVGVACFALSLRDAHNCCIGADARRGETRCSVALASFDFFSFFFFFAPFSCFSFFLFASLCFASFSFIYFARVSLSFASFFLFFFIFSLFLLFILSLLLRFFTFHYSQRYGGFIGIRRRLSRCSVQHHLHLLWHVGSCLFLGLFLLRMLGSTSL